MKHAIYPEKQGTPTATSEDANYPIANLVNSIRKKKWKAASGVQTATVRLPISANASVVAIVLTNAETAICTITLDSAEQNLSVSGAVDQGGGVVGIPLTAHGYTVGQTILLNGTTNYDGIHILPAQTGGVNEIGITATFVAESFDGTETACVIVKTTTHTLEATRTYDSFWEEYTEQVAAHTATIKLTAGSGETVEAGVVRAGTLETIRNPEPGVSETPVNYHVVRQYKGGSFYTRKRDTVRSFSYSMTIDRDTYFYDLMELYDYWGPDPFMMLLADSVDEIRNWIVFGKFDSDPSGGHLYPSDSTLSVSILEVV